MTTRSGHISIGRESANTIRTPQTLRGVWPAGRWLSIYGLQLLSPIIAKASAVVTPQLSSTASSYVGRYQSQNGLGNTLVAVLDGKLSLIIPEAANPYIMRAILEPTDDPRTFTMRPTGAFATDAFGERLTFDIGADGQVVGYRTPYLRYTRIGALP